MASSTARVSVFIGEKLIASVDADIPQSASQILLALQLERGAHSAIFHAPCGGHKTCRKCRIRIRGSVLAPTQTEKEAFTAQELAYGFRLACCTEISGDAEITILPQESGVSRIRTAGIFPSEKQLPFLPVYTDFAAAVDIGTTTIAAALCSAHEREPLAYAAVKNPQDVFGADVLARISASLDGHGAELSALVLGAVDSLLFELLGAHGVPAERLQRLVISANTSMLYLLTGRNPRSLASAPFAADCRFACTVPAGNLSVCAGGLRSVLSETPVYMPLCISAFSGADVTAALTACGAKEAADSAARPVLLADIGTNAEMVLYIPPNYESKLRKDNAEKRAPLLLCCSAAAGPAFEGGGISCGMFSAEGAIHAAALVNGDIVFSVIGGGSALGICGSGLLDAIAVCVQTGLILEDGSICADGEGLLDVVSVSAPNSVSDAISNCSVSSQNALVLAEPNVLLTQHDIRNFQLAKSAVCAGLLSLLEYAGIGAEEVQTLYLAGGFGTSLNAQNAAVTGLVPQKLAAKICSAGNASLSGAVCMLQNKDASVRSERYAEWAQVLSLAESKRFQEFFMQCMRIGRV